MTIKGIVAGILAGGVVTASLVLVAPRSRLLRILSPILGVAVAYLIMRLL
ncbi:MAG TPA: hypothetical protein VIL07_07380 [Symbiobacteriaceae bacterium]